MTRQANKFWNVIAHFVCVCVSFWATIMMYILESYNYRLPKFIESVLCGDIEGISDVIQLDSSL